jgi:pimeloyl-ACP methyl ester carboxylesterase
MQATAATRVGVAVLIDANIPREHIVVRAADGVESWGILYTPRGTRARTVVCVMHPRGDMSRHYIVPGLVRAGYAVFAANSRYLNNDRDMVHERILLDIAAGQQLLRERGYEARVLFGNSGGGALFAFYQAQAVTPPPGRIRDVPGDPRLDLNEHDLPPADVYVSVASHPGQGLYLMRTIDPAVVDESDPTLTDPTLDMFNPENGYRPLPSPSRYDLAWLVRYREAQRARVARLDALARAYLDVQAAAHADTRASRFAERRVNEQVAVRRIAALDRVMVIYRTLANPAFLDPSIEPNERPLGSIFAADPLVGNYAGTGLARVVSPRGWLSTWSGLSSRAVLTENLRKVTVPTLIVNPLGDSDIFPADAHAFFEASAAEDKQLVELEQAGHYLTPLAGSTLPDPRERLIDILVPWLRSRVP